MWRNMMNRLTRRVLPLLALPLVAAAAACGSSADGAAPSTTGAAQDPVTTAGNTTPPAPPTSDGAATTSAGAAIDSYGDVQPAVVQIVAKGTFRDPEIGYADGSGL